MRRFMFRCAARLARWLAPPYDEIPVYEACGARQGQTWPGGVEIPSCWLEKGHVGQHEDPAVVVRWNEPASLMWGTP